MSELRNDPLTGRWVILAPGRADRPNVPASPPTARPTDRPDAEPAPTCPFCPGNEHLTPPEVARRGPGAPDTPGWLVRVVPNRYPIVGQAPEATATTDPLRQRAPAGGAHEVVVLSPDHHRSLAHLSVAHTMEVLLALRDRVRTHAAAGHRYTQVMVNQGAGSGASIAHPHAQLVAIDAVPPTVTDEVEHVAAGGHCVICAELQRHASDPSLPIVTEADAALWCPWWSATAFELLLAPRRHRARFDDADDELEAVARTLGDGLRRLERVAGNPAYNLYVHTLPAGGNDDFHWHVHIRPRLQQEAGFELGTGILVNTLDPATAAERLR